MLPPRTDETFPSSLKEARESKNLTYAKLARLLGITQKNIPRYEKPRNEENSSIPSKKTWEKINTVLFNEVQDNANLTKKYDERIYLTEASVEDIIHELKSRGITNVNIGF